MISFDELRLEMTNALMNEDAAWLMCEYIRQNAGWLNPYDYRQQTILMGIYGDLISVRDGGG